MDVAGQPGCILFWPIFPLPANMKKKIAGNFEITLKAEFKVIHKCIKFRFFKCVKITLGSVTDKL